MRWMWVGALLLLVPGIGHAQDSVRLRHAPAFGSRVQRVFQIHTRMEAHAESVLVRETVDLGGMAQVATVGPAGERVIHLSFDSLRTVVRDGDGPWRQVQRAAADSAWMQVALDPRLEPLWMEGAVYPEASVLWHLVQGVPNLVLPAGWLRRGDVWQVEHDLPLAGPIGRGGDRQPIDRLRARTTLILDSVMTRAQDTLAFLRLEGSFDPTGTGAGGAPYGGGLAGSLVWSSGWSTFVSGAVRYRVTLRMSESVAGRFVTVETTTRHQVQSGT